MCISSGLIVIDSTVRLAISGCCHHPHYKMNHTHSRIESLKTMIGLEEHRAQLQQELDSVVERLTNLYATVTTLGVDAHFSYPAAKAVEPVIPRRRGRPTGSKKSANSLSVNSVKAEPVKESKAAAPGKRAKLKDKMFAILEAAGSQGVFVKNVAEKYGEDATKLYAWFSAADKRYPSVKKLGAGHYGWVGTNGKSPSVKQEKSADLPVARKLQPAATPSGRSPRGALTQRIFDELEASGSQGIAIGDLADKLGAQYKNISIWFATTGKNSGKVKKVARGVYALA